MFQIQGISYDPLRNQRAAIQSVFLVNANKWRRPMLTNKRVLIIGFDPKFLDFSSPELAPMNLTAEKVNSGTAAEIERLRGLGYEPDGCFVDLGETAETVVASRLRAIEHVCVIIHARGRGHPQYL